MSGVAAKASNATTATSAVAPTSGSYETARPTKSATHASFSGDEPRIDDHTRERQEREEHAEHRAADGDGLDLERDRQGRRQPADRREGHAEARLGGRFRKERAGQVERDEADDAAQKRRYDARAEGARSDGCELQRRRNERVERAKRARPTEAEHADDAFVVGRIGDAGDVHGGEERRQQRANEGADAGERSLGRGGYGCVHLAPAYRDGGRLDNVSAEIPRVRFFGGRASGLHLGSAPLLSSAALTRVGAFFCALRHGTP